MESIVIKELVAWRAGAHLPLLFDPPHKSVIPVPVLGRGTARVLNECKVVLVIVPIITSGTEVREVPRCIVSGSDRRPRALGVLLHLVASIGRRSFGKELLL